MDRAKESVTDPAEDVESKAGRRNFRAHKARPGGKSGNGAVREKKRAHARRA